jgi:hypothetical protein
MTEPSPNPGQSTPGRGLRISVGVFAGMGATGIAAFLGLVSTFTDSKGHLSTPSPLILIAPLVVVPGFAGAVLRGRAVVLAIMAGAVAAPMAAIVPIAVSCPSNLFAGIGMAAAYPALVIAGVAAFIGSELGGSHWQGNHPRRDVMALMVVGVIGTIGWVPALSSLGRCP